MKLVWIKSKHSWRNQLRSSTIKTEKHWESCMHILRFFYRNHMDISYSKKVWYKQNYKNFKSYLYLWIEMVEPRNISRLIFSKYILKCVDWHQQLKKINIDFLFYCNLCFLEVLEIIYFHFFYFIFLGYPFSGKWIIWMKNIG